MRIFLIHVRYIGAMVILTIGAVIACTGELIMDFARWIGSRSK